MKRKVFLILGTFALAMLASTSQLLAQAGPPGGGGAPCWPPSPTCPEPVPINSELWILLAAGITLGFYFMKKNKLSTL